MAGKAVSITAKPTDKLAKINNYAISKTSWNGRDVFEIKSTWSLYGGSIANSSKKRATHVNVHHDLTPWRAGYNGYFREKANKSLKWGFDWDEGVGNKACTIGFFRNQFYPYTGSYERYNAKTKRYETVSGILPKFTKYETKLRLKNKKGCGPWSNTIATFTFNGPKPPTFDTISFNDNNASISTKLKFTKNECAKDDTSDCMYKIYDQMNFGSKSFDRSGGWKRVTNAETNLSADPNWANSLSYDQWGKIIFEAYTRGIKGDSSHITTSYVYAWPAIPSIEKISYSDSDPKKSDARDSAMVIISYKSNKSTYHPTDTLQLQVAKNSKATRVSELNDASWSDVSGQLDNAHSDIQGFTQPVLDALPEEEGCRTWYRIKATHGNYTVYSVPKQAEKLYLEPTSAVGDQCKIVESASMSGNDGESLIVVVAFKDTDNTGTEFTWSDKEDAWNSTDQPSSFNAIFANDSPSKSDDIQNFPYSQTLIIRGLTENQQYYVMARRYYEGDDTTYGQYSAKVALTPTSKPTTVSLDSPDYISTGSDLELSWSFDSEAKQTAYKIDMVSYSKYTVQVDGQGNETYTDTEIFYQGTIIEDTDSLGYKIISWNDILSNKLPAGDSPLLDSNGQAITGSTGSSINSTRRANQPRAFDIVVSMTTGGGWTTSNVKKIKVVDPPQLGVQLTEFDKDTGGNLVLRSKPLSLVVESSTDKPAVTVFVTAKGISQVKPDGVTYQLEGDVVWSQVFADDVSWQPNGDIYKASVSLDDAIELIDSGSYTLQAVLVDISTGLSSSVVSNDFSVEWEHQASTPELNILPNADNMSTIIQVVTPENARITDVIDLYRHTPDGSYLIANDLALGSIVTDMYAPYCNKWGDTLDYRAAMRTKDGDIDFMDEEYELYGYSLCIDTPALDATLELPYNVKNGHDYKKGFEARKHRNGKYAGYFDGSIQRIGSLETDTIKVSGDGTKSLIKQLANDPNPSFVRTPDGAAYTANVDVSMSYSYDSLVVPVKLSATEIAMSSAYRPDPTNDILVPANLLPSNSRAQVQWGYDELAQTYKCLTDTYSSSGNFVYICESPLTTTTRTNVLTLTPGTYTLQLYNYEEEPFDYYILGVIIQGVHSGWTYVKTPYTFTVESEAGFGLVMRAGFSNWHIPKDSKVRVALHEGDSELPWTAMQIQ